MSSRKPAGWLYSTPNGRRLLSGVPAREQATVLSVAGKAYSLIGSRRRGGTASSRSQRGKPSSHSAIQPVSQPGRGSADAGLRGNPVKAESRKQNYSSSLKWITEYPVKKSLLLRIYSIALCLASLFACSFLLKLFPLSFVVCWLLLFTFVIYLCFCLCCFCSVLLFLFLALALLFLLLTLILAPNAWRLSTGSQWGAGSSHHARRHRG